MQSKKIDLNNMNVQEKCPQSISKHQQTTTFVWLTMLSCMLIWLPYLITAGANIIGIAIGKIDADFTTRAKYLGLFVLSGETMRSYNRIYLTVKYKKPKDKLQLSISITILLTLLLICTTPYFN